MDTSILFRVAPTFPIDDRRIRERRLAKVIGSPVTIGSVVGATVLGIVAGAGVGGFLLLYVLTGFGLRWFWRRQAARIELASVRELIAESNAEQDREMQRIIRRLDEKQLPHYAVCLGRFLLLKQKIEQELHRGPVRAPHVAEIEKLIDGVCAEVCREITKLTERQAELAEVLTSRDEQALDRIEDAGRKSHASILHAYTTLYRTHGELLDLETVGQAGEAVPPPLPTAENRLNQLVVDLKGEAELIARTSERIRGSLAGGGGTAAPQAAAAPPALSE